MGFIGTDQGNGLAGGAGTAGATDAVHVVFRHIGQVYVYHLWQLLDVQAPGSDVGGDQCTDLAVLEVCQGPCAGILALVAVDGRGFDTVALQLLGQLVGAVLGTAEHQYLEPVVVLDQVSQQGRLALFVHRGDPLGDQLGGGVAWAHIDFHRIVHQAFGQGADFRGEGGRKHQVLPFRRQFGEDLAYVVDETHVEHTIRFVQHQYFQAVEFHCVLLIEIQQAPGSGYQNIGTATQALHLRIDLHTAEYHGGSERQILAVGGHTFGDLGGQFPGGGQYQGAYLVVTGGLTGAQALQQGQGKTGGLAGAGLGSSHDIAAAEYGGDGLGLDR